MTWPSTANVIVHTGATPVFVDSDYETGNLDASQLESVVSDRTKGIIAVSPGGGADLASTLRKPFAEGPTWPFPSPWLSQTGSSP